MSVDLDRDSLIPGGDRIQIRVEVSSLGGPDTKVHAAVEMFDTISGRTTAVT